MNGAAILMARIVHSDTPQIIRESARALLTLCAAGADTIKSSEFYPQTLQKLCGHACPRVRDFGSQIQTSLF